MREALEPEEEAGRATFARTILLDTVQASGLEFLRSEPVRIRQRIHDAVETTPGRRDGAPGPEGSEAAPQTG